MTSEAQGAPSAIIRGYRAFAFPSIDALLEAARSPLILVALNAEKIAASDERVRRIVNANVGYADGMGVVLALRRRGLDCERIAGADLWMALVRVMAGKGRPYLVGSRPQVVREVVNRLKHASPALEIAGFRNGYLDAEGLDELKRDLVRTRPDAVFVGMGSPHQELLMDELMQVWPALYMGLGGSFDIYAGRRRRAPAWMQRIGLEWAFRFADDPRRLPRLGRYLRFAWWLARGKA